MLRRTQTVYIETDPFFSPRGKILHRFDEFLEELARAQMPCVWMTGWTRAQLDEPRRRLGQSDPFIGEHGAGVYLPEDYFHLKGRETIRLGRYTCIPIAKPQPAAKAALEELSSDLEISVVPLRNLSHRELSQNTGLPAKEADLIRSRDFDELFFFAGAGEADLARFRAEAEARGLTVLRLGQFWSLSCGGSLAKCVKELGALYDRALRAHALRIGVRVPSSSEEDQKLKNEPESWPDAAFDNTLSLGGRREGVLQEAYSGEGSLPAARTNQFHLHAPTLWDDLMARISPESGRSR